MTDLVFRCEVTNEPIPANEGGFLSYSVVVHDGKTWKRMNKGIRIGNSLAQDILHLIEAKRRERKTYAKA